MNRTRWIIASVVTILVCALACTPIPSTCTTAIAYSATFHFESDCTTPLCGFVGVHGNIRIAGTFHPAEHGLQIDGGAAAVVALAGPTVPRAGESVSLIARCDPGMTLRATEVLTSATATELIPVTDVWGHYGVTFYHLASPGQPTSVTAAALSLQFEALGAGSCTVDDIRYVAEGQTCDPGDAGSDVRDRDRVLVDVRPDAVDGSVLPPSFGPCTVNSQCGVGGRCLTKFPGGMCTRACTRDPDCGSRASCIQGLGLCLPRCVRGAATCDPYGGACATVQTTDSLANVCVWSCFPTGSPDIPPGYPLCPADLACNPYSGACGPGGGQQDGTPCSVDADCHGGFCIEEYGPEPTGWLGGYCVSSGRMPPITVGQRVPQANCPPDAGVVPLERERTGDLAVCLKVCETAADCRPGYGCNHLVDPIGGGALFSNGVCYPIDCAAPGQSCPAGTSCSMGSGDGSVPIGICVTDPSADAGGTDSSTDGAVDADVDAGMDAADDAGATAGG